MGRKDRKVARAAETVEAPLSPTRVRLLVALAALVLLVLAWHRYATVASEPDGRFEDPDAAFHARRATRAVVERTFLPPIFDAWEDFPEGGRAVWPPLHDATLALLARLGGSTPDQPTRGLRTAAALPVIELVGVLLVAALLAGRVGGDRGALLAAWLVALTPALPRRGAFGEIDHNITEILGALLLLLLATRLASLPHRLRAAAPLLWGAAVLLALGFYTGLVLSAGLAAGAVLVGELLDPDAPRSGPSLASGFALAALLLPFFAALRVRPDPADPWRLGPVYALILAIAAAGSGILALLAWRRARGSRVQLAVCLAALGGAAVVFAWQPRAAWPALVKGLGFLGSREVWLSSIEEFRPLVTALSTVPAFTSALLPGIAALVLGALALRRERRWRLLEVLLPALAFLALGLVQRRFLAPACAFAAVAAGAMYGYSKQRMRVAILFAAVLGVVISAPRLLRELETTAKGEPVPTILGGEAIGSVLGEVSKTAPSPGSPPAWGVLASWDFGHQILRLSGQAVAMNNFGSMQPGFARKLALFLEPSPARAVAALTSERIRYVVASYPPGILPSAAAILGRDPRSYLPDGFDPDRPSRYEPTPLGERTLVVRLHLHGGRPFREDTPEDAAALRRFRELWASPETIEGPGGVPLPFMRLFELLPANAP
jgi:asparagine N-glycosylation enzyme membrane subunit Stt3